MVHSYNKQTNLLCVYRRLLTNRLHGKAAEPCLANSCNNSVTTTKYMYIKGCFQAKPYKYRYSSCQAAVTSELANKLFHVLGKDYFMLHKILGQLNLIHCSL